MSNPLSKTASQTVLSYSDLRCHTLDLTSPLKCQPFSQSEQCSDGTLGHLPHKTDGTERANYQLLLTELCSPLHPAADH